MAQLYLAGQDIEMAHPETKNQWKLDPIASTTNKLRKQP